MKIKHNKQHHDRHHYIQSNSRNNDDFNILEPAPDIDLTLPDDDEDELSDYTLMDNTIDLDYEE